MTTAPTVQSDQRPSVGDAAITPPLTDHLSDHEDEDVDHSGDKDEDGEDVSSIAGGQDDCEIADGFKVARASEQIRPVWASREDPTQHESIATYFRSDSKPDNNFILRIYEIDHALTEEVYNQPENAAKYPREFEWKGLRKRWTKLQAFYFVIGIGPGGRIDREGQQQRKALSEAITIVKLLTTQTAMYRDFRRLPHGFTSTSALYKALRTEQKQGMYSADQILDLWELIICKEKHIEGTTESRIKEAIEYLNDNEELKKTMESYLTEEERQQRRDELQNSFDSCTNLTAAIKMQKDSLAKCSREKDTFAAKKTLVRDIERLLMVVTSEGIDHDESSQLIQRPISDLQQLLERLQVSLLQNHPLDSDLDTGIKVHAKHLQHQRQFQVAFDQERRKLAELDAENTQLKRERTEFDFDANRDTRWKEVLKRKDAEISETKNAKKKIEDELVLAKQEIEQLKAKLHSPTPKSGDETRKRPRELVDYNGVEY